MTQVQNDSDGQGARRARGLARMNEVYGFDVQDGPGDFFALTADHLFGEIWEREGLTVRDRRLLLLGALSSQGMLDVAEIQVGAALGNGELDEHQLREISIFLCHYVGWPTGTRFDAMVGKVLHQRAKAARSDHGRDG
ncbi:carboxymuconolactone decarboxylase family protein [Tomitella fengzijianii]|uniref:Carboxymuconolactone decarboxylase family protein n=1 Tax=Tomitella fengzijianii TaxID=2597660 RepID=A0A516X6D0_9ACTN|nr:carboxymuconolactone decarboxylase family protein [Tomitella fengzijianii]QDQ98637.1 carboxymuconolactone decarboxylase family protein [Tomitella fengzijianii]